MFGRLPFIENDTSANSALKLFKKDINKFFNFHTQKQTLHINPSSSFKELFKAMVESAPSARATIEDIKGSSWYNKDIYSEQQLKNVMSIRLSR
mmetsp:Transcript_32120/g.29053  ORF Transcript_32120/g.29053 Transcript_32120/m.29053 type:complete len:94 (+) Transcript_32120:1-282(+)